MEEKYFNSLLETLYEEQNFIKILENNCDKLRSKIIAEMEKLSVKTYTCDVQSGNVEDSNSEENKFAIKASIIERTNIIYDLNFVKSIVPEAIEKTLTVDKNNMEEFKSLLKSFGLKGKQVNELVKVMRLKNTVNPDVISRKIDKGEISSEDVSKIADINVTSRYLKVCKKT